MAQRTVVVTGASSGIGRACALRLDVLGFRVLAGVRRDEDAAELARRSSPRLRPVRLDVTDAGSLQAVARELGDEPLAGLVNNAGIAVGGPLEYLALDQLRRQLEVNVVGTLAATQAFLPHLRRGPGRVVMLSSAGGRVASAFVGPYCASKFALEALSVALRQELSATGISVVVVEPGAVRTPIWGKGADQVQVAAAGLGAEARQRYGDSLAGFARMTARLDRRGIAPEKVADVVAGALTCARPRPRYLIGADARAQVALQAVLPARVLDALTHRLTGV